MSVVNVYSVSLEKAQEGVLKNGRSVNMEEASSDYMYQTLLTGG